MELIETYDDGCGHDIEVFRCKNCGRTYAVYAGGDVAFCWCEFEEGD
jgi:hypothetical protein